LTIPLISSSNTSRKVARALWINAGLLLAIFFALVAMNGGPRGDNVLAAQALSEPFPPIAGAAGLFVMPAQFSRDRWGCYLMDIDAQTLVTYEYNSGENGSSPGLALSSARNFRFDRRLKNFNTIPDPREVARMLEKEDASDRVLKSRPVPHPDPERSPKRD